MESEREKYEVSITREGLFVVVSPYAGEIGAKC